MFYLPVGAVEDGTYSSDLAAFGVVAETLPAFLDQLVELTNDPLGGDPWWRSSDL